MQDSCRSCPAFRYAGGVKGLQLATVLGVMLALLAGCGSSAPPPFSLSCSTRRLPSGFIRAVVQVRNSTGHTAPAYVYGPHFDNVRHIFPVSLLTPTHVVVTVSNQQRTYFGFLVGGVPHQKPAVLILRFIPPANPVSILVADRAAVHASSWDVLKNPQCVLRSRG